MSFRTIFQFNRPIEKNKVGGGEWGGGKNRNGMTVRGGHVNELVELQLSEGLTI